MGDKIITDKENLVRIADTVRLRQSHEELLSIEQIFDSLEDNLYILEDESGNQLCATYLEQDEVANATANDIRIGKTAITEEGLITGTNTITYRTATGSCLILPGNNFSIPLEDYDQYDYTKFQCIIVLFDSNYNTNVTSMAISIDDGLFSTEI